MALTMADITPVGLCIATQELFDARRFRQNFCDHITLRLRDRSSEQIILPVKRELNSPDTQKKFLQGHKAVIASNIDKIISLASRYSNVNLKQVSDITQSGREMINKVLFCESFDDIARLEPTFRSKISLPVYSLFLEYSKQHKLV